VHYVYILRSLAHRDRTYVGLTRDLDARLAAHNAGRSPHTAKHAPWEVIALVGLPSREQAIAFEDYLKSGSGRAFCARHFLRGGVGSATAHSQPRTASPSDTETV
jgi:putative endonuclease